MTKNQLEQAKKQLREEMRAKGYGAFAGGYRKPPQEYHLRNQELWCIEMINSILAYGCHGYTAEQVMQAEERGYRNYLADYVKELGRARVVELIQGQIDSIAYVRSGVYTDYEGVTYNSIVWKEETT